MIFEAGGKQYITIAAGPCAFAKARLVNTAELKYRHATVLYVFAL